MKIMRVNNTDYRIIKLLGKGKGGYSYLAESENTGKVVLKQIHHEPCDYYTFSPDKFERELRDYQRLCEIGINMPRLYDSDNKNERLVKEFISGFTVYDMIKHDMFDTRLFLQVKRMCETVYSAGLNIDWYPTNFMVKNGVLYYVDYECNPYCEQWDFEHWGINYWSKTEKFMETLESAN